MVNLLQLKIGALFNLQTYWTLEELQILASSPGISCKAEEDEILQDWIGKPKDLLQILWEHGWINPCKKLQNYVVKESKQSWLDFKSDAKKLFLLANCLDLL